MSGAVNVEAYVGRVRREVHPPVDNTDFSTDVQFIKPLDVFLVDVALARPRFHFQICLQAAVKLLTTELQIIVLIVKAHPLCFYLVPRMSRDNSV